MKNEEMKIVLLYHLKGTEILDFFFFLIFVMTEKLISLNPRKRRRFQDSLDEIPVETFFPRQRIYHSVCGASLKKGVKLPAPYFVFGIFFRLSRHRPSRKLFLNI